MANNLFASVPVLWASDARSAGISSGNMRFRGVRLYAPMPQETPSRYLHAEIGAIILRMTCGFCCAHMVRLLEFCDFYLLFY